MSYILFRNTDWHLLSCFRWNSLAASVRFPIFLRKLLVKWFTIILRICKTKTSFFFFGAMNIFTRQKPYILFMEELRCEALLPRGARKLHWLARLSVWIELLWMWNSLVLIGRRVLEQWWGIEEGTNEIFSDSWKPRKITSPDKKVENRELLSIVI